MAQSTITSYFNNRKRAAVDDLKSSRNKVVILDQNASENSVCDFEKKEIKSHGLKQKNVGRVIRKIEFKSADILNLNSKMTVQKPSLTNKTKKKITNIDSKQPDLKSVLKKFEEKSTKESLEQITDLNENKQNDIDSGIITCYPTTPTKKSSTMDKIASGELDSLSLNEIKLKLSRSNRLAELKASLSRVNESIKRLERCENEPSTSKPESPGLKAFKTIDLEVPLSPQKLKSPLKSVASPIKSILQSPRKNLFGLSPMKNSSPTKTPAYEKYAGLVLPGTPSLTLPYKYRYLAEIFHSMDNVCSMLYNRNEIITFTKLKPAVQEILRKNFTLNHLAQIKHIYPDAFNLSQQKVRKFGTVQDKYELVIRPVLHTANEMNPTLLLERKRKLFKLLLDHVKNHHEKFLQTLDPPLNISKDDVRRWHPEFEIEDIPDIEESELPQPPNKDKLSSASDVLSKAKDMINYNSRMEKALERLKEVQSKNEEKKEDISDFTTASVMKGIPKALLEKVRAKQAAKALEMMTRTPQKDKEISQYKRLPELAKLTRNIFVAEKKSVLPMDNVFNKLNNSYRGTLNQAELEEHLKLLSNLLPGWLVFHEIRKTLYLKLSKDTDMTKVLLKLERVIEEKEK